MPLSQGVRSHDCILSQVAECKLSSTVSHSSSCCSSKDAYWIGDLPIPLLHRAFATLLLRSLPHPTHIVLPHDSGNRLHFFLLFGPPWSMTTLIVNLLSRILSYFWTPTSDSYRSKCLHKHFYNFKIWTCSPP